MVHSATKIFKVSEVT